MGGSVVSNLTAAREVDASSEPLIIHGDKDEEIQVPDLSEILVPLSVLAVTSLPSTNQEPDDISLPDPAPRRRQDGAPYRHVSVAQKRRSELSYSVQGNDLRKRRRLNKEQVTPAVSHLSDERYLESFVGGEVSKKEYFLFHNLPWPPAAKTGLLSLSQGKFLSEQRMKDLNFVKSGGDTPGDGNYKRTEMEDCKLRIRHVHQDWNIDVGI